VEAHRVVRRRGSHIFQTDGGEVRLTRRPAVFIYNYLFTAIGFAVGGSSPNLVQTITMKQHYTVVQHNTIKRKQHNTIKRKHKIIRTKYSKK
jgi:hypothetical protein